MTTITPPMASVMLASNTANRKLNNRHVEFLADQILSGKWQNNGQTIVIADDGTLMDGQHRLSAIVKANKSTKLGLCTGAPRSAMASIDNGKLRSTYDVLSMINAPYAALISSAMQILYKFDHGEISFQGGGTKKMPNTVALSALNQMQSLVDIDILARLAKLTSRNTRLKPSNLFAAFYLIAMKYGQEFVEDFAEKINNGGDYPKSPTTAIGQIVARVQVQGRTVHRIYDFALLLSGFEKWINGNTMSLYRDSSIAVDMSQAIKRYKTNINW
tara:strand:- start:193 stop:1011 length:819 start_codon:yes stop_codon:yes gene_type:complete